MADIDERYIINILTTLDNLKDEYGDTFSSAYPEEAKLIEDALYLYYDKVKEERGEEKI
ncbi:hypothetical protein ACKX2L_06295 [Lachnospiraceae bacterium YH-ros2228]